MPESWQIRVYDQLQPVFSGEVSGRVELGRQESPAERLYSKRYLESRPIKHKDGRIVEKQGLWRLVIASREEYSVSRDHAYLEPAPGGRARLENVSGTAPIRLQDGRDLEPSESTVLDLPTVLTLGGKVVRILEPPKDGPVYQRLPESVSQVGLTLAAPSAFSTMALNLPHGQAVEIEAIRWLKATMGVLQSAASSSDFFDKAARAIVESVGLDTGFVVLLQGGEWKTVAAWSAGGQAMDLDTGPSKQILARVLNECETLYHVPELPEPGMDSLLGVSAVVAAPIMGKGEVIGAMYGDRRRSTAPGQPPKITELDAMLMDVLAASVAAGMARMEGERAAVQARVQFEQFFTPELAHMIADRPELLEGQDADITLLFADIRGFSRISERLGPAKTVRWVNDVMSTLSDCVLAHRGVLVDYIGDELMAMWGAPEERPDHAELACRAAVDMIKLLPEMNERFLAEIGEQVDLGIGINTGIARVGNTGSKHKFKYGPLGNTVNLASRVQGITKYMKARLLVTEATRVRLSGERFASRRLGKVRVVNIGEPVTLYELAEAGDPKWEALCLQYESALAEFERRGLGMAARILATLMAENPEDGPSLVLLSRAVNGLVDPEAFDPVFVAPGK